MIVNRLIEKAMVSAQGAQASLGQNESTNVSFENDRLKSVKSSQSTGMSVKVIASEARSDLQKEIIIETVSPTILCNGNILRFGEIVVGLPAAPSLNKANQGEEI